MSESFLTSVLKLGSVNQNDPATRIQITNPCVSYIMVLVSSYRGVWFKLLKKLRPMLPMQDLNHHHHLMTFIACTYNYICSGTFAIVLLCFRFSLFLCTFVREVGVQTYIPPSTIVSRRSACMFALHAPAFIGWIKVISFQ